MERQTILDISSDKCTGCGLCVAACAKQAISMQINEMGYLHPTLNNTKCVSCGICYDSCPTSLTFKNIPYKCYSFYLNNKHDLLKSASGGVASAIAAKTIKDGGIVYGVCYSDDFHSIEYRRFETPEDVERFRGSKYAEPCPPDYRQLLVDARSGRKVAFFGLPCHIAAARIILKSKDFENVTLCALMCLGKASSQLYKSFIAELEAKVYAYEKIIANSNFAPIIREISIREISEEK